MTKTNFKFSDEQNFSMKDHYTFMEEFSQLDTRSRQYLASLHGMVVRACKAVICRKDTAYLKIILNGVARSNPVHLKKILDYTSAICGSVSLIRGEIVIKGDEVPLITISHTVQGYKVALNKKASDLHYRRSLEVLKEVGQKRFDLFCLPKKQTKKLTAYDQAVNFYKTLARNCESGEKMGQLTAYQRGQLSELLQKFHIIFPGILD